MVLHRSIRKYLLVAAATLHRARVFNPPTPPPPLFLRVAVDPRRPRSIAMAADRSASIHALLLRLLQQQQPAQRAETIHRAFATEIGQRVTQWWACNSVVGWRLLLSISLTTAASTMDAVQLLLDKEYINLTGALEAIVTLPQFHLATPQHRAMFDFLLSRTADEQPLQLRTCLAVCTDAACRAAIQERLSKPSREITSHAATIAVATAKRLEAERREKKRKAADDAKFAAAASSSAAAASSSAAAASSSVEDGSEEDDEYFPDPR